MFFEKRSIDILKYGLTSKNNYNANLESMLNNSVACYVIKSDWLPTQILPIKMISHGRTGLRIRTGSGFMMSIKWESKAYFGLIISWLHWMIDGL